MAYKCYVVNMYLHIKNCSLLRVALNTGVLFITLPHGPLLQGWTVAYIDDIVTKVFYKSFP
jgi:hypothetical protein